MEIFYVFYGKYFTKGLTEIASSFKSGYHEAAGAAWNDIFWKTKSIIIRTRQKQEKMRQKLNLITLGTDNFEKSLAFYENGLGWKKSAKSMDGLALFDLGGIILALHPRRELAEDTTLTYQPTTFSGLTISHNTKSEKEVDEILEKVANLGATIVKPAQKVYLGWLQRLLQRFGRAFV